MALFSDVISLHEMPYSHRYDRNLTSADKVLHPRIETIVGLWGMTIDLSLIIAMHLGFASLLSLPYIQLLLWLVGAVYLSSRKRRSLLANSFFGESFSISIVLFTPGLYSPQP